MALSNASNTGQTAGVIAWLNLLDTQVHRDAKGRVSATFFNPDLGYRVECDWSKAMSALSLQGKLDHNRQPSFTDIVLN